MASIIDTLREYVRSGVTASEEEYEVDEYVLERRDPDPEPRVRTYADPVTAQDVVDRERLPSGVYLLQEIKASGMAGDVVWREELTFEEP